METEGIESADGKGPILRPALLPIWSNIMGVVYALKTLSASFVEFDFRVTREGNLTAHFALKHIGIGHLLRPVVLDKLNSTLLQNFHSSGLETVAKYLLCKKLCSEIISTSTLTNSRDVLDVDSHFPQPACWPKPPVTGSELAVGEDRWQETRASVLECFSEIPEYLVNYIATHDDPC